MFSLLFEFFNSMLTYQLNFHDYPMQFTEKNHILFITKFIQANFYRI